MLNSSGREFKLGLVLGAGGSRGFCHIGVLDVLQKYGITPDIVTGSSMGALVGGCFAAGVSVEQMLSEAKKANFTLFSDLDMKLVNKRGLIRGDRVVRFLSNLVGKETLIENLPIPYGCVTVDLYSGDLVVRDSGFLVSAIRSSIAIPGLFRPVMHEGRMLVDGGILCRLPIRQARDMGADLVLTIDALGPYRPGEKIGSLVSVLHHVILRMDYEITSRTIGESDLLISPDMGDKNELVFKGNAEAIEAGRVAMEAEMPRLLSLIENYGGKNEQT